MSDHEASAVEWRDIPGYEGLYQVSSDGQVKRLAGSYKCIKDRILKQSFNSAGYLQVALSRDGKPLTKLIHNLVTLAFFGNPGDLWCNHKNGIKTDNRVENLEYVTPGQNNQHAYDTGLHRKRYGEHHWSRILSDDDVHDIRFVAFHALEEIGGRKALAKQYGVSLTTIQAILSRKGGYGHE